MEIVVDEKIREKWHRGFSRGEPVSEIIIHGTGGGGTYNYVLGGGRAELYIRGVALFHYLVERDGKIIEVIHPKRWVYHSSSGKHDEVTIGIELLNPDIHNKGFYTNEQYKSLFYLMFDKLMLDFPTINIIRSRIGARISEIESGIDRMRPQAIRKRMDAIRVLAAEYGLGALEGLADYGAHHAMMPGQRAATRECLSHMEEALTSKDTAHDREAILAAIAMRIG